MEGSGSAMCSVIQMYMKNAIKDNKEKIEINEENVK